MQIKYRQVNVSPLPLTSNVGLWPVLGSLNCFLNCKDCLFKQYIQLNLCRVPASLVGIWDEGMP